MREFDWIARYFAPLAAPDAALRLRDDAALIDVPTGMQLAITTDTINEHVHFLPHTPAEYVAHKALAVNLSDLAAMGAAPLYYSLALSLPRTTDEAWMSAFANGLAAMQSTYGIHLIGGDTTATHGPLSITITAYGLCENGKALRRSSAKMGDTIYVSGTIGDAVLGLCMAKAGMLHPLRNRYECPTPRCVLAQALVGVAHACMDISDGLVQDLGHLCAASVVAADVQAHHIPLHPTAQEWVKDGRITFEHLITGGDDYELLFTLPASSVDSIEHIAQACGVALTAIGTIGSGSGVTVRDELGKSLCFSQGGYQHF